MWLRNTVPYFLLSLTGLALTQCTAGKPSAASYVATYSIVACDPETGELGVAVQSKFFSVGSVVPWAEAGVGAVATQALCNISLGPEGLRRMRETEAPDEALASMLESDPLRERRQVGMVDAKGQIAVHTGAECFEFAGHRSGEGYAVQGNILAGPEVVDAMAAGFEAAAEMPLADRLMQALQAGEDAGGDRRGRQSAALLVVRDRGGYQGANDRYIDLRVEDHPDPTKELARLLQIHRQFFIDRHAAPTER